MNVLTLMLGILSAGLSILSAWLSVRSILQSQHLEGLQTALRSYNQGLYNSIWRIGDNADRALKADNLAEAQQLARGIGDMSHTARNVLIAFSREHARFIPEYEAAWDPNPLGPEPARSRWRWLFRL